MGEFELNTDSLNLYYVSMDGTNDVDWSSKSKCVLILHLIKEYSNRMDIYGTASPLPQGLSFISKNKLEDLCKHYYYTDDEQ